ncbi:MAG: methyltransferase domain-containing protein [Deltaproteobacteria bacterium]|nr:methyltransferase domain-containing protein [Deltaproteobacteria bacterium]MBW2068164.1 methyltransferase domain-containing protein [Deltaproteobacteria bacterium]
MSRAHEILEELREFMKNRVVLTAAELGLFDLLVEKPGQKAVDIAKAKGLNERALSRLMDCLVALGYLEKEDNSYFITEKGEFLSSGHQETILPMVLHYVHLWDNWSGLTDSVKLGYNPRRIGVMADPERQKSFIGAMHVVGRDMANEIAAFYDASDRQILLDVGGGSGVYTIAFLKRHENLRAVLFDLPDVIPIARQYVKAEGLEDRVEFVEGDFYGDPLPSGSDLVLLSAIIHQNSPSENISLYRKAYDALVPGGKLLIRDHVMDKNRTSPPAGTLFALNMLVCTPGGDTYTFPEIKAHLEKAGFSRVRLLRKGPKMDCLVEAEKER